MNREEILKMAQEEGGGINLPDQEATKQGGWWAYAIGALLLNVVLLVNRFVLRFTDYGAEFALLSMFFVLFVVRYRRLRGKLELVIVILFGIPALIMLALWILQLCGV